MRLSKRRKAQHNDSFMYEMGWRHLLITMYIILVIALIIGGIAFAQVPILPIGMGGEKDTNSPDYITAEIGGEYRISTDDEGHTFIERINANITFEMLFDYAEECYNDSTNTHTHNPKWNDGCLAQRGNLASGYWFEIVCELPRHFKYLHKKPTLPGFIEWLKEKQK